MKYLKQIWFEMRHQKLMTWVTVSGTALSVFMVMTLFMTNRAKTIEMAPELNRMQILTGKNIHTAKEKYQTSSGLHSEMAKKIYGNLEGIELVSYLSNDESCTEVSTKGGVAVGQIPRYTDAAFWKLYDYTFLFGKPYDEAEVESDSPMAVITRSAAHRIFGEENAVGKELYLHSRPYIVKGVIKDVSPLMSEIYADIYVPLGESYLKRSNNDTGNPSGVFGNTIARLLMADGTSVDNIRRQVRNRYSRIEAELRASGMIDSLFYHEQPYTTRQLVAGGIGSNGIWKSENHDRNFQWILYSVLILLPAINLSSMTRSRLRHRISEIGVRRAFGASRRAIMNQMLTENLIITLLGGLIGLVLSLLFITTVSHLFMSFINDSFGSAPLYQANARPTFAMLFSWTNFFIAVGLCLILNIISTTLPAWKASHVNPADAISRVK